MEYALAVLRSEFFSSLNIFVEPKKLIPLSIAPTVPEEIYETNDYFKVLVGDYKPIMNFSLNIKELKINHIPLNFEEIGFEFEINKDQIFLYLPLEVESHIVGMGERAQSLDLKRKKLITVNTDPGGYSRGKDPIYLPIPFFIKVSKGDSLGIFVNYPGKIIFDFGIEIYNKIKITIDNPGCEVFIFKSKDIKNIINSYMNLTGKPFMPPRWSLGHTISRYTYYPAERVFEIVKKYKDIIPIEAVYLDIDYMDGYKLFTWNKELFGDGKSFLKKMHDMAVKVVTILDPSIKSDQNYTIYKDGLGNYLETKNKSIYNGEMWPGNSVFPDFLNNSGREFWKRLVIEWLKQGIDGIWLDMNEPTILTEDHLLDPNTSHKLDNDELVLHKNVRNLYPLFQNKATYEAFLEAGTEPFILTRSGYSGIQKYAAVWTGDNKSTWDDVKLQISMVSSLSISGVMIAGCDLGGFFGESTPDLVSAYYRMALFFPLYRNHKSMDGNDQEIFLFPTKWKDEIISSVTLRYEFIDYLYNLVYLSHKNGTPVIEPLYYDFSGDDNSFFVDDEYMVGSNLLYAPQIYEKSLSRSLYLPEEEWIDFWTRTKISGPVNLDSSQKYPLFLKNNSYVIYKHSIIVYGKGKFTIFISGKEFQIESDGHHLVSNMPIDGYKLELIE